MSTDTLKSLPEKEYLSGMGEVIKHGLIRDKSFYLWLKDNSEKILARDDAALEYMAKTNCSIKRAVVENDFKEQGERAHLNFGHTLGHAIEKYVYGDRLHGECVSIGMNGAAYISMKKGYISKEVYKDILETITAFKLPVHENRIDIDNILEATVNDKKMEAGKLKFIVLRAVGEADIDMHVGVKDMTDALKCILGEYHE